MDVHVYKAKKIFLPLIVGDYLVYFHLELVHIEENLGSTPSVIHQKQQISSWTLAYRLCFGPVQIHLVPCTRNINMGR